MATPNRNAGSTRPTSPTPAGRTTPPTPTPTPPSTKSSYNPTPKHDRAFESKPGQGEVTRQQIAEAAYYLYLQRGGNDLVNWLDAEAMLRAKSAKAPSR